jgi:transposase
MSTKMDEDDWAHTLAVFRACLPRRGRKAEDDRRFLEALHFFTVENVRWRALPERFGHWNSVWRRFDRLSRAGVFEAFFDALASMSSTAHLLQMFDSTVVRAHVSAAGAKGGKKGKRSGVAWRLHHENSRKIGRLRGHHRLRPDRRRSLRRTPLRNPARHRTRHSAPRRHLSTKATPARPIGTPRERAASPPSSPTRPNEKNKPAFFARTLYKARARIEQGVGRLKRFKRVALRCEKTERNFRSIVSFAAGLCLIKFVHTA